VLDDVMTRDDSISIDVARLVHGYLVLNDPAVKTDAFDTLL